ncbi:MAG: hypothetical protein MJ179_00600 [Treponema sp.]|nr:hypothetical protein [Treponema sp.]
MTLKNRNRTILALLWISIGFLLINSLILFYAVCYGPMPFSSLYNVQNHTFFLFASQPLYLIIGIFIQNLFAIVGCFVLYRSFVKTQSTEVIFFTLFLFAVLSDVVRLWIPALELQKNYSALYMFCGNTSLFSILLVPSSLLLMVIVSYTEQKQENEKIVAIFLLIIATTAVYIPLNTSRILHNYAVDYPFKKTIIAVTVLSNAITLAINYFYNKSRTYNQKTTVGLLLIMIGIHSVKHSINIVILLIAIILLTFGSIFYIKELHNQYLWTD